jgi:hypothetical protein
VDGDERTGERRARVGDQTGVAQLDSMPLNAALVLTVSLVGGGRASLSWDYR